MGKRERKRERKRRVGELGGKGEKKIKEAEKEGRVNFHQVRPGEKRDITAAEALSFPF